MNGAVGILKKKKKLKTKIDGNTFIFRLGKQ